MASLAQRQLARCLAQHGGAAAAGSIRAKSSYRGPRGSKGWGWFHKFKKGGNEAFRTTNPPTPFEWGEPGQPGRRRAWLRFDVDGRDAGRVEIELAGDVLPVTCENFARLCEAKPAGPVATAAGENGTGGGDSRDGYSLVGTAVHRIVKGVAVVAGDVENLGGRGSHSALGSRYFADEAFLIPHSAPGLLSMANSGVHTNGSQFYMTLAPAPHLDGRCVAFARVLSGLDTVKALSEIFSMRGKPVSNIRIAEAGVEPAASAMASKYS